MSDMGFAADAQARTVDAGLLGQYMANLRGGFSESDLGDKARRAASPYTPQGPVSFAPAPEPRHFTPANPGTNPTAGWDIFNPDAPDQPAEPSPEEPAAPDLFATARAEGFSEGFVAGEQSAALHLQEIEAIDRLAHALARIDSFDREAVAARLRQTVLYLVTRLVGETGISADLLAGRIEAAITLLADSSEPAQLKIHPDDLKLVEGRIPEHVRAVVDRTIERGEFRIETRITAIEDGPDAWLGQLAAAIDRTALPDGD